MEEYFYFFNKHWILTLEFISILILILINELFISRNSKKFISINTVIDLINHKNAKIFDIRNKIEFSKGYIKNSINISINDIENNFYKITKYRKYSIIICAENNNDAKKSMIKLKQQGLLKISILNGGIKSWVNAGLPLLKIKEIIKLKK